MMSQDKKYREFWIEQFNGVNPPKYKVFLGNPEDMDLTTKILLNGGDLIPAREYFLTVEYQALDELKAENLKLKSDMGLIVSNAGKDLILERDELKAENELLKTQYQPLVVANKETRVIVGDLAIENESLTLALRDMVGALERLTKVGPPSVPTTGEDWAAQGLKDNCEIAKASLAKHADLIGKLK